MLTLHSLQLKLLSLGIPGQCERTVFQINQQFQSFMKHTHKSDIYDQWLLERWQGRRDIKEEVMKAVVEVERLPGTWINDTAFRSGGIRG